MEGRDQSITGTVAYSVLEGVRLCYMDLIWKICVYLVCTNMFTSSSTLLYALVRRYQRVVNSVTG